MTAQTAVVPLMGQNGAQPSVILFVVFICGQVIKYREWIPSSSSLCASNSCVCVQKGIFITTHIVADGLRCFEMTSANGSFTSFCHKHCWIEGLRCFEMTSFNCVGVLSTSCSDVIWTLGAQKWKGWHGSTIRSLGFVLVPRSTHLQFSPSTTNGSETRMPAHSNKLT